MLQRDCGSLNFNLPKHKVLLMFPFAAKMGKWKKVRCLHGSEVRAQMLLWIDLHNILKTVIVFLKDVKQLLHSPMQKKEAQQMSPGNPVLSFLPSCSAWRTRASNSAKLCTR